VDGPYFDFKELGLEIIKIINFVPDSDDCYAEFITSKNYGRLDQALVGMRRTTDALTAFGVRILRQKIESHPRNECVKLYTEVHYKVPDEIPALKPYCFFSCNEKGTLFATERFDAEEIVTFRPYKFVAEDVIYDSNRELDWRLDK
jgi:hypothetical protein